MLTPAMTRKGVSALDWIRTNDTRFRRAVLYPLSYEGLVEDYQRIGLRETTTGTAQRRVYTARRCGASSGASPGG